MIERLDRLARELFTQEWILRDLKKLNVTLVPVVDPDMDSNPERILFRQMMGAIAQHDKTMIVAKLKAARDRKRAKTGRCEGQRPYGDDKRFASEAAVRDRIRAMRKNGHTLQAICDTLNGEGIKTRHSHWMPMSVQRIAKR